MGNVLTTYPPIYLDEEHKKIPHNFQQKGVIVSGFPGVGKSTAASKWRGIEDVECTAFHYDRNGALVDPKTAKENPHWVSDYVDHIERMSSQYGYPCVLVSSHEEVRKEMDKRGLQYVVVIPSFDCYNDYLQRYLKRGDMPCFIKTIADNWSKWIHEIETGKAPVIMLERGQFLEDILPTGLE